MVLGVKCVGRRWGSSGIFLEVAFYERLWDREKMTMTSRDEEHGMCIN